MNEQEIDIILENEFPILRYYIPYYLKGNTIIIKDQWSDNKLSIMNKTNSNGELFICKSIWQASDLKLPLKKKVKWEIKDKYLNFYNLNQRIIT